MRQGIIAGVLAIVVAVGIGTIVVTVVRSPDKDQQQQVAATATADTVKCIHEETCIDLSGTEFCEAGYVCRVSLEGEELDLSPAEKAQLRSDLLAELRAMPICPPELSQMDPNSEEALELRSNCRPPPEATASPHATITVTPSATGTGAAQPTASQ